LIKSLHGCNRLTKIVLNNVEFKRPIGVGKVFLPSLRWFELSMHQIETISATEFMAHVFFYQNYTTQDNTIGGVEIIVRSEVDGKELWFYNPFYFPALSLTGFSYDVACFFYYEALHIEQSVVYPSTFRTNDVKEVSISADNFYSDSFEVLKHYMKHLYSLRLYRITDSISLPTTVSIDLSSIPTIETMKTLYFRNLNI